MVLLSGKQPSEGAVMWKSWRGVCHTLSVIPRCTARRWACFVLCSGHLRDLNARGVVVVVVVVVAAVVGVVVLLLLGARAQLDRCACRACCMASFA